MAAAVIERPRRRSLVLPVDREQEDLFARRAMDGLAESHPEFSARVVLTHEQKVGGVVVAVVAAIVAVFFPVRVGQAIATLITLLYGAAVYYRVRCFSRGLRGNRVHHVDDDEARAFPAAELPVYTVLVPAYREPEVIGALLRNVARIDYPADKLDVMILLEADDDVTLAAVREADPADYVRVVVVPAATLTTKPRACNYGLEFARGTLVTIFDAEDEPDPLQLRKSAIVFGRRPPEVCCLQARLAYSNADQNIVTKWFTAEYLTWFNQFLPGLAELGSPIPLGGTSNHLRLEALRRVGGWDPYNVTEDADLGLRLAREGYLVENLDSVTFEEANSDFINWVKQRSRWLKGYLLTWLVHMRHPVVLRRQLGWRGFAGVNLFIGGTPLLAVLNPLVWGLTLVWFLLKPPIIQELFSGPIYYLALLTWVLGNFTIIYMGLISIRETARPELLASMLLVPLYWVMMALAAVKGVLQLIRDPAYWEKTTHGLGAAHPSTTKLSVPRVVPSESPTFEAVSMPQGFRFTRFDGPRPAPAAVLRYWQQPDAADPRRMLLVTRAVRRIEPARNDRPSPLAIPSIPLTPHVEAPRPGHGFRLWFEPDPDAPGRHRLVTSPAGTPGRAAAQPARALRFWFEPDPDAPGRHRLVTKPVPPPTARPGTEPAVIELRDLPAADVDTAFHALTSAPASSEVARAEPLQRDAGSRRPKGRHRGPSSRNRPG